MVRRNKKNKMNRSAASDCEKNSSNEDTPAHSNKSGRNSSSTSSSEERHSSIDSDKQSDSSSAESTDSSVKHAPIEYFEEKFTKMVENAAHKSEKTRSAALKRICETFVFYFVPDRIEKWKMTLIDCVEKSLRRAKGSDQIWSARLSPLLALQLSGDDDILKALNEPILGVVKNASVSYEIRSEYCRALGLINFLSCEDSAEFLKLMKFLETIFCSSYLRGDNKVRNTVGSEAGAFHAAALSSWALILTVLPSTDFMFWMSADQSMFPSIENLIGLLQSPHLKVCIAAGNALALIVECGRLHEENFLEEYLVKLIDNVKQLANDTHKYHSKRKRKTQHSKFRDLLLYLENNIKPKTDVRFGNETLVLDTWQKHHQYAVLCALMGSGMNTHLAENYFVRDILQINGKMSAENELVREKLSKSDRNKQNNAVSKARTKARRQNRDKRVADFTEN